MSDKLIQNIALSRILDKEGYAKSHIEYTVPSNITEIAVKVPEWSTIDDFDGFTETGDSTFICQNNSRHPSLTLTIPADRPRLGVDGTSMADLGEWAILEAPQLITKWRSCQQRTTMERQLTVDDKGVAGEHGGLVYLGPYTEHTRRSAGQRFRLIEPDAASLTESPADILDAISYAARWFRVSGRHEEVVCIAAPTVPVNWGPGGVHAGGNAYWARDDARLDVANNTWIHEYIHTYQKFSTDASMQWLIEAMAVYYGAYLTFNQDMISPEECHAALNTSRYQSDHLGEPSQWSSQRVPYRKGSRVIHWLDHQLRTNTSASLVDVLDAINSEYDGSITDLPTNSTNPSSTHDRLTFDSFLDIIEDIIGSTNDGTLINTIETNLHAAVYGSKVPPETSPTTGDIVDTDVSPDPRTISEVEDLFDKQKDITLESESKDSDGEVSSVTDVQDMFGATTQSSSTQQSSSDEDSNSNDITDTDDMFG